MKTVEGSMAGSRQTQRENKKRYQGLGRATFKHRPTVVIPDPTSLGRRGRLVDDEYQEVGVSMRENKLKAWRQRLGFTQVALADAAHCAELTIVQIETLNAYPRPATRTRIAKALGLEESFIWPEEGGK